MTNQSNVYKLMKSLGIRLSESKYGNITMGYALQKGCKSILNAFLLKYCMYSVIFSPWNYRLIRPAIWRWIGAKVGKNTFIGYEVWMDFTNARLIELEDHVHVANRCLLLCHKRDIKNYWIADTYSDLPYAHGRIHLKRGCAIGMGTIILPGVTIGEGSVIGAGSIVTKDIPDWTIALGCPAKVVQQITERS